MRLPRRLTLAALPALSLLLAGAPLLAQAAPGGHSALEQDVLTVVTRLFDGMRARDTAMVRSVFAPGAELKGAGTRNGTPGVASTSADEFIRMVGAATGPTWDERIHHPEVRIDGNLASVWTVYDFYLGDKLSHCGVDAFHLARFPDGWKIIALADTRRREGCGQAP